LIPVWRACWPGDAPGNFLEQTVCFSDLISSTLSLNSLSSFSHRFGISNCRHQFVWTNIYVMVDDDFMNNSHAHLSVPHEFYMELALAEAKGAATKREVPIGAVVV